LDSLTSTCPIAILKIMAHILILLLQFACITVFSGGYLNLIFHKIFSAQYIGAATFFEMSVVYFVWDCLELTTLTLISHQVVLCIVFARKCMMLVPVAV
jgi:hypothetical protein